jgi:hypothetical protein
MIGSQPCVWVRTACDNPFHDQAEPEPMPNLRQQVAIMTDLPAAVIPNRKVRSSVKNPIRAPDSDLLGRGTQSLVY